MRSFDQLAADQRRLISAYCRLDFEGGRLSPTSWGQMSKLSMARENPEFSFFLIVLRYQMIEDPTPSNDSTVAYTVIGKYEEGVGFTPMRGLLNVTFKTRYYEKELRIDSIDPGVPLVSRKAALDWLKSRLAVQKDEPGRAPIKAAINALETQGTAVAPK